MLAREPYTESCMSGLAIRLPSGSTILLMSNGNWADVAMENPREPNPGDVCKFWSGSSDLFIFGVLSGFDSSSLPFETSTGSWYKHAEKITNPEIIKIFKNA